MKEFIKKYLSISRANSSEIFGMTMGDESIALKNRHETAFNSEKESLERKTHCKIVVQGDISFSMTDLNSKDFPLINGKKIRARTPISISAGDEIEFRKGGVKISFELDTSPQAQEETAAFRGQAIAKEYPVDAGIVLSYLVRVPTLSTVTAACEEVEKPDISDTIEKFLTEAEINTRERFIKMAAKVRSAIGDFFSNSVFCSYYAGVTYLVLGLVLGGSYLLMQLDFAAEEPEIKTAQISNAPIQLEKEDINEYTTFNNLLPVAESKTEAVELTKETQPIADNVSIQPIPEAKQLASNSPPADIEKQTIKKRLTVKNKKRHKHRVTSKSSDPHIDAWAKEFFTN